MNYYKRFYGSKYWLWRWGYYCGMKNIGKNAGDHRITKAISKLEKRKRMKEEMTVPEDFDVYQFCLSTVSGDYPYLAE